MYKNLLAFVLLLFSFGQVLAIPITVNFSAYDFINNPVTDPVLGTIVYEANDEYADIDSLTSISLIIAGHTYTIPEIGFLSWPSSQLVGGTITGVNGLQTSTDDFLISWNNASLIPGYFVYVTAGTDYTYSTTKFRTFSVNGAEKIPEPTTLALMGLGLAGIGWRRKKAA